MHLLSANTFLFGSDWNILSPVEMRKIVSHVPTTVGKLKSLHILSDKKIEEYGVRMVKMLKSFVEHYSLESHLVQLPKAK